MVKKKEKNKGGRPTDYKEEYDRMAKVACSEGGFTDKKLALLFNCAPETIRLWKKAHNGFMVSIKEGKDEFDSGRVEKALLKICLGIRYTEKTKEARPVRLITVDEDGTEVSREDVGAELMLIKTVRKFIVPNDRAIRFWLRNRRRKRWPDRKDVRLGGDDKKPLGLFVSFPTDKHLTMAEWQKQVEELNNAENNTDDIGGADGASGTG